MGDHYISCTIVLLAIVVAPACAAVNQPHIVFVVADDLGWNDIGYRDRQIQTPNLDKLARGGVNLSSYYVHQVCSPSRAAFMTGRYPYHVGLQSGSQYIPLTAPYGVPLDETFLPEKLKTSGYATHMVGKWHLGFFKEDNFPVNRGFDSYFGYLAGAEDYWKHSSCHGDCCGLDLRNNTTPANEYNGTYSTYLFAGEAARVISQHPHDKPLFLYLAFQSVHAPLQAPDSYIARYGDKISTKSRLTFAAMVTAMDDAVGNVTAALQAAGMWDNTIFVFTTDNGGNLHAGGNNWPLRGGKFTYWEGGVRGVSFVYSNLLPISRHGSSAAGLMHAVDWMPTLLRLAGADNHTNNPMDGVDMWDMLCNGAPSKRTSIVHNINQKGGAIRVGDYKLLIGFPGADGWIPRPNMSQPLKYKEDKPCSKTPCLFNIAEDPEERNDLATETAEMVAKLVAEFHKFNSTAHLPVNKAADDKDACSALHKQGAWGPWE